MKAAGPRRDEGHKPGVKRTARIFRGSNYLLFCFIVGYFCFLTTCAEARVLDLSALWNSGGRCVKTSDYMPNVFPTCRPYVAVQNYTYVDDYQYMRDRSVVELSKTISSDNNCTARSVQLVCSLGYRECSEVDVPGYGKAAIGNLPCEDFCQLWRNDCMILYAQRGGTYETSNIILNCTVLPYFWGFGFPEFQNGTYTKEVIIYSNSSNVTYEANATLPCFDKSYDTFAGYGDLACPEGTHNSAPNACALNCPEPLISDNQYDQAMLMLSIVGWFSLIGSAFVVVSFLLAPKTKLSYPAVLSFFFIVCIMCQSFTWCLGSMAGFKDLWCKDENTPNRWGDGWCTIQGITYVYFTLAGGLWWLAISINLVATVVFRYSPSSHLLFNYWKIKMTHSYVIMGVCHLLCWGIPLVVIIICLSAERIGYGGSDFWCTIHSDENISFVYGESALTTEGTSDEQAIDIWNLILLTIPMMIITLVGTCLFITVVIVALVRSRDGLLFFWHQWRLLGLLCLYIWIYSFVFSAHIQFATQRRQQYQDYATYIDCLKVNSYFTNYLDTVCDSLPQRVNFYLWIIASFNVCAGGFFVFLIFGTSKGVVMTWANLLLCIATRGARRGFETSSTETSARDGVKKIVGMPATASSETMRTRSDMTKSLSDYSYEESVDTSSDTESADAEQNSNSKKNRSNNSSEDRDEEEGEGEEMKEF